MGQYLVNMCVPPVSFSLEVANNNIPSRFPDRVGRVVIDGVADAHMWSSKFEASLLPHQHCGLIVTYSCPPISTTTVLPQLD